MTNNPDANIYSVIELKKSLKRTMIQLQKAIDILNQNSPDDLPNLTVVEDLVKSSNALVDYLQLKKVDDDYNTNREINQDINPRIKTPQTVDKSEKLETKKVKVNTKKSISFFNFKQNLWLVIVLVISITFNIFSLVNNSFSPLKNTSIATNQEIVEEKSQEINIGDNIFLEDNIQENKDQEETPLLAEKPYPIGENIFQEETPSPELENDKKENKQDETNINLEEDILLSDNLTNSQTNNQDEGEISADLTLPENVNKTIDTREEKENINNQDESNEEEKEFSLLELNPEKYIIKNVENQINNITKKYSENLIIKVKANFAENSIVITLSEKWYNLNANQQNNFANDIFKQVKSLDLYKFKLENREGKVLARNAVVGDRLIIIP